MIAVMLLLPNGLMASSRAARARRAKPRIREPRRDEPAQRPAHLTKRFGGLIAVDDVSLAASPARRSRLGDRPERRRQEHASSRCCPGSWSRPAAVCCCTARTSAACRRTASRGSGVVRTFQETTIFKDIDGDRARRRSRTSCAARRTIVERRTSARRAPAATSGGWARARAEILELLELSAVMHEWPRATCRRACCALLGIAMGLAARPQVLLLDEPFAGMNPEETDRAVPSRAGSAASRHYRCCWSSTT